MTGIYAIMRSAIRNDGTLSALINSRVYRNRAPDNQLPPFIVLKHSGNSPIMTAAEYMIERPRITLNAYVQGSDSTTLDAIWNAVKALLDAYNEQSGGLSYDIKRIFDLEMVDEDKSLMWTFEYLCAVTTS